MIRRPAQNETNRPAAFSPNGAVKNLSLPRMNTDKHGWEAILNGKSWPTKE
jgi:hypothetical protein